MEKDIYKSIKDIRRGNLEMCVSKEGGQASFLAKYSHKYDDGKELSSSHLNQLLSGKASFGDNVAERIERMIGKPKYWFDTDHTGKYFRKEEKENTAWPFSITKDQYQSLEQDFRNKVDRYVTAAYEFQKAESELFPIGNIGEIKKTKTGTSGTF